jgi:hypothetical protein
VTAPADIRTGLKAALDELGGFNVLKYQRSVPAVETIWFFPDETTYDAAGTRGLDEWVWTVQAFLSMTIDEAVQQRLDDLLDSSGATSIKAALEADPTLGGAVDDLRVVKAEGYQLFQIPGAQAEVIGSTWTVHLIASG